jgi:hypothetical protein
VTPNGATIQGEEPAGDAAVPRLELTSWALKYGLTVGVTTREQGFNLGLHSEDPAGQVTSRWQALRGAVRDRFPGIVLGNQCHGTQVHWHDRAFEGWLQLDGVDGHATDRKGLLLLVTVADCIPVYLAAPKSGAIALLHAGWRGTADRILARGLHALTQHALVRPSDVVMHCGVGICGTCYEVGSEVAERLTGERSEGATQVDLRGVLARQAAELGIPTVSISPYCSAHDREVFYSHRASQGRDGRMVAYLGRPK